MTDILVDSNVILDIVTLEYRCRGGQRRSPLPDFYIGAHAVIAELSLLTRDVKRYRTYFPNVQLISPVP